MSELLWLHPLEPTLFPEPDQALDDPNGLLAAGGDLSLERLVTAYQKGIFPWYEEGQPILWWSPDPRTVLYPENFILRRSLRKVIRNKPWTVSFDRHFDAVIRACAQPRPDSTGTWITDDMVTAYNRLHIAGYAHSVEVWDEESQLIGGLYGVAIGRVFFGESMFSLKSDASKVAYATLVCHLQHWGYRLIDCQIESEHLLTLGAENIKRQEFSAQVEAWTKLDGRPLPWSVDPNLAVDQWDPAKGQTRSDQNA
jgi:leucyl/phenylalanyl-tRNA--protein transferase